MALARTDGRRVRFRRLLGVLAVSTRGRLGRLVRRDRLSRDEIITRLNLPPDSSLWSIDIDRLSAQVEAHPWIRSITFDRVFPHSLAVQVEERQPAAVLGSSKKGYFLDAEGHLLPGEPAKASRALPVLEGMSSKFFNEHLEESHRRAKQGIHLAELLSEHFSGRPRVNVAHAHTTIVDLPRIRFQFGQEAERQWQRFLVLYPSGDGTAIAGSGFEICSKGHSSQEDTLSYDEKRTHCGRA